MIIPRHQRRGVLTREYLSHMKDSRIGKLIDRMSTKELRMVGFRLLHKLNSKDDFLGGDSSGVLGSVKRDVLELYKLIAYIEIILFQRYRKERWLYARLKDKKEAFIFVLKCCLVFGAIFIALLGLSVLYYGTLPWSKFWASAVITLIWIGLCYVLLRRELYHKRKMPSAGEIFIRSFTKIAIVYVYLSIYLKQLNPSAWPTPWGRVLVSFSLLAVMIGTSRLAVKWKLEWHPGWRLKKLQQYVREIESLLVADSGGI